MKKLLTLIFILGILLGACTPAEMPTAEPVIEEVAPTEVPPSEPTEEPQPEVMTFVDGLGNTIEFTEYPQAIVSISASTTEILFAIGAGDQVVGRDEYSLYPEEALNVTNIGALWDELPVEAILDLEPDLIVAAQIISEDQVMALQDLGLNVYWQANPTVYEDLWQNLRDFAMLTGHEEETEILIADLEARVKAVQKKIAPLSYHYGVTPEVVVERAGWDVITAVAENALYPIDPNMMSVPGPRLVDALEETAKLLHPELFE